MDEELLDLTIKKGKIINPQSLSGEVNIYYQKPKLNENFFLNDKKIKDVEGIPKIKIDNNIVIEKNSKNANKYKGRIFLCNDGKFYISQKNNKGKYVWKILDYI